MTSDGRLQRFLKKLVCGADQAAAEADASVTDLQRNVPKGNLAVYVGKDRERFVIPVKYLNNPHLADLLEGNSEDCSSQFRYKGALVIPCGKNSFECALNQLDEKQNQLAQS